MKRTITIGIVLAAVTVIAFGAAPLVNAQTASTSPRCTVSKPRLVAQADKVDAAKDTHIEAYADLRTRVEALIVSSTTAKYAKVSAITTAKNAYVAKVTAYTTAATAYTKALQSAADAACGESETTYNTALTSARTALTKVRNATTAVKTSFNSGVVPTLQDYAKSLATNSTNGGTN